MANTYSTYHNAFPGSLTGWFPTTNSFGSFASRCFPCLHTQTRNSSLEMQQSPSWRHTQSILTCVLYWFVTLKIGASAHVLLTQTVHGIQSVISVLVFQFAPLSHSHLHTHVSLSCPRVTVSLSVWTIIPDFHGLLRPANVCPSWSALQCPATASVAHEHDNNNQSVS